jgi:hypothetical protein
LQRSVEMVCDEKVDLATMVARAGPLKSALVEMVLKYDDTLVQ